MPRKARLDPNEPTLRLALKESDYRALLDHIEGWDHPVYWRMRSKWADHLSAHPPVVNAKAATPRKRRAKTTAA